MHRDYLSSLLSVGNWFGGWFGHKRSQAVPIAIPQFQVNGPSPNVGNIGTNNYFGGGNDGKIYERVNQTTSIVYTRGSNEAPEYAFHYPRDLGGFSQEGSDGYIWTGCMSCHAPNGAYNYAARNSQEYYAGQMMSIALQGAGMGAGGNVKVPVYRVYGGGASIYGKSYSLINPKYVPFYRTFAGLPNVNSGEYLLRGSIPINNIRLGNWFAKPLDGNIGGLPFEFYQNYNQLFNPFVQQLKKPF